MNNFRALRAIVTAGLVVGVLDISSALAIWWQRGIAVQRGLQGIAAGLLGHEVIRRRTRYGRLGSGDSLLRCIRSSVDLLLDQPQDTVFDEKAVRFRRFPWDWRLHGDVLDCVADCIPNVSPPALQ